MGTKFSLNFTFSMSCQFNVISNKHDFLAESQVEKVIICWAYKN